MQLKHLTFAALTSAAYAQSAQDLNATLAGVPELSNLTMYLNMFPEIASFAASATNVTILAPNNDAFGKLLGGSMGAALASNPALVQAVLTYHILNGTYSSQQITDDGVFVPTSLTNQLYANVTGGQRVKAEKEDNNVVFFSGLLQNSTVTRADVAFSGGVVHIIDSVLTVPVNVSTTAVAANLTSLAGALGATNLTAAVDTTPDVTIFAPTNEAFAAIGSVLANASTEELSNVLTYHVVNGTVAYSADLRPEQTVTALNGQQLTIRVQDDGDVFVNGARVVIADVLVANGVVHVIDSVLNPANTTAAPAGNDDDQGSVAFPNASPAAGGSVPFTSGVPTPTSPVGGAGYGGNVSTPTTPGGAGATPAGPTSGAGSSAKCGAYGVLAVAGVGAVAVLGL